MIELRSGDITTAARVDANQPRRRSSQIMSIKQSERRPWTCVAVTGKRITSVDDSRTIVWSLELELERLRLGMSVQSSIQNDTRYQLHVQPSCLLLMAKV